MRFITQDSHCLLSEPFFYANFLKISTFSTILTPIFSLLILNEYICWLNIPINNKNPYIYNPTPVQSDKTSSKHPLLILSCLRCKNKSLYINKYNKNHLKITLDITINCSLMRNQIWNYYFILNKYQHYYDQILQCFTGEASNLY